MTNNINPDDNPLLKPPSLNLETGEGIRSFLEWLYDPEVDKAFEQAFPLDENDQARQRQARITPVPISLSGWKCQEKTNTYDNSVYNEMITTR